jgi:hypothetical protein
MKRQLLRTVIALLSSLLLFEMPTLVSAQPVQPRQNQPPIASPLVREGDFAVQLISALEVGTTTDEIEAESLLGAIGITPRNGWIADYPVTPDIIGELQKSVGEAADAGKLGMSKDEAVKRLNDVNAGNSLAVTPYTGETVSRIPSAQDYPDPTVINDYYYQEGPPVYTYYVPPPDYYYLYSFVPYPFWSFGFWFPGYFILHDFHRPFFYHGRHEFCSNHFNDVTMHRVFRVDPVTRYNGRTFAGIGAPRKGRYIDTGITKSDRTIFNAPRTRPTPGMVSQPPRSGKTVSQPLHSEGTVSPSTHGREPIGSPIQGEMTRPPSSREGMVGSPPSHVEGTVSPPPPGGGVSPPPHGGGGFSGGASGGVRR